MGRLRAAVAEPEPPRNQRNYRITDADRSASGSLKRKCQDNLAAIELLQRLEAEGRAATDDEKRVLVRYVGWGGLPQVFDPWNDEWKAERQRLEQLLTPDELDSARATTLNAHYTAPVIVRAMYAALQRLGFTHGRVLEPALGLGHFIGLMPEEMHARSLITGIEIDSVTARLAKLPLPRRRYPPSALRGIQPGRWLLRCGASAIYPSAITPSTIPGSRAGTSSSTIISSPPPWTRSGPAA